MFYRVSVRRGRRWEWVDRIIRRYVGRKAIASAMITKLNRKG